MKTEETTTTAAEDPQAGSATPKQARSTKPATKKTSKASATKKPVAKAKTAADKKAAQAQTNKDKQRTGTKKSIVLELLSRKEGATTAEIAKATNWQNHSIRGFISGNVSRKMGLAVESSKNKAGECTYRIAH